jgi:cytochrome c oxidase subunit 2
VSIVRRGAKAPHAILVATSVLGGCGRTPMSYLTTNGPAADAAARLGWGLISLSIAVIVIIFGLLLSALFRHRPTPPSGVKALGPIGRKGTGLSFIYVGTGFSTLVLFVFVVWSLEALGTVANPSESPGLTVQVTGHQFWWEVRYIDAGGRGFLTADEIHIPVGAPVRVELSSADVIHSFWVPKLVGKTQMIPGQTNVTWMQADTAGNYRGECTQLCGLQHAHMAMVVIAEPSAAFTAWWNRQLMPPASAKTQLVADGERIFQLRCASCHAVRGTNAGGLVGPNLSHLAGRETLGAATIPNDPDHLAHWVNNTQDVKPGNTMPTIELEQSDQSAVVAYLETLE